MKRPSKVILAALAALVLAAAFATSAVAASPHFNKKDTSANQVGDNLNYTWTLSGLGNDIGPTVQVDVHGVVACVNGGGKHPKAQNKQGVDSSDVAPVHNGTATHSGTLSPPDTMNCGTGQDLEWLSVSFSYSGATTLTLNGPF